MLNLGIFLTDASFDKKTKTSSISFIEKESGYSSNYQTNEFVDIFSAEYEGILIAIKYAFKRYNNIIIICDNKGAISKARRELFKKMNLGKRFSSVQFLWLPRDYLVEADFLTKNVHDYSLNKQLKISGTENLLRSNVLDIFVDNSDINNILDRNISSLELINDLSVSKFKSNIFKLLFDREFDLARKTRLDIELMKMDILYIIDLQPKEGKKGSSLQKILEIIYNF